MSFEIVNPESLGVPRGWNHGMLAPAGGRLLFVAGQTGKGADFAEQFGAALDNILAVVRKAGGDARDIGRFTIYVRSRKEYLDSLKPLGAAYRERMGRHFPAMSLVEVSDLVDAKARVEIEATAVLS